MKNHSDEYREKVYDFLYRMPVGKVYVIDNICKADSREKFIQIAREFMEATLLNYSYGLEFSGDYTTIRKDDVSGLPDLLKRNKTK